STPATFERQRILPSCRAGPAGRVVARGRLQLLNKMQLAHACPAKVRPAVGPVGTIPSSGVHRDRPLVLLMHIEESLRATGTTQGVVRGSQKPSTNPH